MIAVYLSITALRVLMKVSQAAGPSMIITRFHRVVKHPKWTKIWFHKVVKPPKRAKIQFHKVVKPPKRVKI